jgi:hypothetical protein
MVHAFLSIWSDWRNRIVWFLKPDVLVFLVVLRKPDVLFCQIGLSDFVRQNICFSQFDFCEPPIICITYYLFTHTFIAHLKCMHIGGALMDFLKKCAKWHLYAKIWIPFNMNIFRREPTPYVWIKNAYWIFFWKL